MKQKLLTTVCALAFTLPAVAFAGDWQGNATLGFASSDIDGAPDNLTATTLDLHGEYDTGVGFVLGVDAAIGKLKMSGTPIDESVNYFALTGMYGLSNGLSVGAYAERGAVSDSTLIPVDLEMTSFGLVLGYSLGSVDGEIYYGTSDTDPSLPAGIDVNDLGLRAAFSPVQNVEVNAVIARTRISGGGPDVDLDLIGLGGSYAINHALTAFGGVQKASLDILSADATTIGLGLAYQTAALGIPTTLSLEVARTSIDVGGPSEDVDTVRVGISIPLGKSATSVPLNSVAGAVANGGHSVLTSALLGVF
ncbi:porin [Thalassovita sp.]|uniref:porin n=1 Tax=Thalassovita sp. TaxID=1979401 RepID=UPI0029DE6D94|nr:porin [Thalassovita sp.]